MQKVVQLFTSENPSALVDRQEFTECVGLLAKLCSAKHSGPILNHIRVSSETGGMALVATNLDIQAETSISADVDARFSTALPATTLLKLMKKGTASGTAILELLADNEEAAAAEERFVASKCAIQLAGMRFVLDAMPSDDFPEPIRHEDGAKVQRFSIASAVLWNAIDGLVDAASTDETRFYLNGIYLHSHNGQLRFVATDGHRLYIQDTNVQTGKSEVEGIIPSEGARFIASLLDGYACTDPVDVELSPGIALFSFRGVAVTLKLIDGTFPDYQRVIPAEPDKTATVAGKALNAAVISLVECTGADRIALTFSADRLAISAKGPAGAGSTDIDCAFEGEHFEIGFEARYLRSAIDAASPDGRNMRIRMIDAQSPALVTGSIGGWTGVLMPSK